MSERDRPIADKNVAKRGRGRPKGSAPYRNGDLAALSSFADQEIDTPGAPLAPFLARRGYGDAAIRRAQALWREERRQMLEAAKLRFDSRRPESLGEIFFEFASAMRGIGTAIADSGISQNLRASMERAEARRKAFEQLGLISKLPFDPANADEMDAALAPFETEMHEAGSPEIGARLANKTLAELPLSERAYLMAILLHAFSLQQRQREIEAEGNDSGAYPGQDARGSR